jgi:hypothetical protein
MKPTSWLFRGSEARIRLNPATASLLLLLSGLAFFLNGCAGTETQNTKGFADAAIICTGMSQQLATAEGAEDIKANSDKLIALRQRELSPPAPLAAPTDFSALHGSLQKILDTDDLTMARRLVVLGEIRDQAQLLGDYFKALDTLAGTDATTPSTAAAKTLSTSLSDLSQSIVTNMPKVKPDLPPGGLPAFPTDAVPLLASGYQSSLIRAELDRSGPAIQQALHIQTQAITFMVSNFYHSMLDDKNATYPSSVESNYTGDGKNKPDALPASWSDSRAKGLVVDADAKELEQAIVAAQELETAFANIRQGKFNPNSIARMGEYNTAVLAVINKYTSSGGSSNQTTGSTPPNK